MYDIEYNQKVLEDLTLYNFLFSGEGFKIIKDLSNEDFFDFYAVLRENIIYNKESHIYTPIVKEELYKCLNLYREKAPSNEFLDDVNNLISCLNTATDENSNEFLKNQFLCHYYNILPLKNIRYILKNIEDYEININMTIASDLYVVCDLFDQNLEIDNFIKKYTSQKAPIVTINYLNHCYPELFKQDEVKEKACGLLLQNNILINDYVKNLRIMHKLGHKIDEEEIALFGKTSKKIMKKIKKI